jgi:hypothetical protein
MIIFERFTQDGVKIPLALPISNITEVSPNAYQPTHSWIKYKDGESIRSMVVVGTVAEIVKQVRDTKQSYGNKEDSRIENLMAVNKHWGLGL